MNTIATFFEQNIIAVFFLYGLAFYSMGLALALASGSTSRFRLAKAIQPLSAFALLHGTNEWLHMFEKLMALYGITPLPLWFHIFRVGLLVSSFVMLVAFGLLLLAPRDVTLRQIWRSVWGLFGFWALNVLIVTIVYQLQLYAIFSIADILARYILAIPGALFGAWALLKQRETFRLHNLPQFGRDLAICAFALIGYGVVGQLFVAQTFLFPSNIINSSLFFNWVGFPIQLLRAGFATITAIFMVRALNIFEVEQQSQLHEAQQAKIESERRRNAEKDALNKALTLKTEELFMLLEVSNLLAIPLALNVRRKQVLHTIINRLSFPNAALLMLHEASNADVSINAVVGFPENGKPSPIFSAAQYVGSLCISSGNAVCKYSTGHQIQFDPSHNPSLKPEFDTAPIQILGLPLRSTQGLIGSLVLAQLPPITIPHLPMAEFNLMVSISQQLGMSIENVQLQQDIERHEKILSALLDKVVDAQESERKRIARELHDATGQSLSAIGMGLRGVETLITRKPDVAAANIQQLKKYNADALKELRRIIANLRPSQLDDLGLEPTLRWYIHEFKHQYNLPINAEISYRKDLLSAIDETALFRIMQEALTNIAKHAHATSVSVSLQERKNQIILEIVDDGIGFDTGIMREENVPRRGWGLLGIQERVQLLGGVCDIFSEPDSGTQLKVSIPIKIKGEEKDVEDKIIAG